MNSASILIKTDPKIKEEAQKTAKELGLSLSAIVTRLLKEFVKKKSVTFNLQNETPNAYLQGLIKQADKDLKTGNVSPKFKTADDFISHLHQKSE